MTNEKLIIVNKQIAHIMSGGNTLMLSQYRTVQLNHDHFLKQNYLLGIKFLYEENDYM